MADVTYSFHHHCIKGMTPVKEKMAENVARSLMLATVLNPHIGYDNAAQIVKKALKDNKSLRDAAVELNLLTSDQFDEWVKPEKMIGIDTND